MWHLLQVTRGPKGWFGNFESTLNQRLVEHINKFEKEQGKVVRIVQLDRSDQYANILVETNNEGEIYDRNKQSN